MELNLLSATAQLAALGSRQISARELLDLHLAQKDRLDPALNAVIRTSPDRGQAAALAIDEARAAGKPLGPLAGLPMTIKDGFDVAGLPAHAGNPALLDRPADCADAIVVERARKAGAVIWGKTNVPFMLGDGQTYNAIYGTTNNPYDLSLTPGGSSGGSAVALATGMTALEIGSDTGGSLRNPASFCGIFSLKPTWGLLPEDGHVPPMPGALRSDEVTVVGPMARTAEDLRLLFRVLHKTTAAPPARPSVQGKSMALWVDGFPLTHVVRGVVEQAAAMLEARGAQIRSITAPVDMTALLPAYRDLIAAKHRTDIPNRPRIWDHLKTVPAAIAYLRGEPIFSHAGYALSALATTRSLDRRRATRDAMKAQMKVFFETTEAIIAPGPLKPASAHDQAGTMRDRTLEIDGITMPYLTMINWIALASFLHLPAVTVPVGATTEGLPIGIQVIGPWGSEERLMDIAAVLEESGAVFKPPGLVTASKRLAATA